MKCVNCGGTEFEKADYEGVFTTPFSYKSEYKDYRKYSVLIARYNHACLKCGLVHQIIDLEDRKDKTIDLLDKAIEDRLHIPLNKTDAYIIGVPVKKLSELTKVPYDLALTFIERLLKAHQGYEVIDDDCNKSIMRPALEEIDGELWILKK